MFPPMLPIRRRIRDNLHGSIDMTALEDAVFAHPMFQRLRRIRQTAFLSYVFPGASHTRFEHSLGVLYLAGLAWEKIRMNQMRLRSQVTDISSFTQREDTPTRGHSFKHGVLAPTFQSAPKVFTSAYIWQALRLAAFMHDLGHPPFSHSGEKLLPTWSTLIADNSKRAPYLQTYLEAKAQSMRERGLDPAKTRVRHEIYTLLLIDHILSDIYARDAERSGVHVTPQDVNSIIAPDIPPTPGSDLETYGAHRLCHEIVSGEFDVDRMDYLLRDSKECGVSYGIFDSHRILDSLAIYADPQSKELHLAIHFSGLAAFEDYLRARHSMYLQLYFHKTSVAAEAMIQALAKNLGDWTLPCDVESYAAIDEHSIVHVLKQRVQEMRAGTGHDHGQDTQGAQDTDHQQAHAPGDADQAEQLIEDLLLNRRLWKRVYELSGSKQSTNLQSAMYGAQALLSEQDIRFEMVSSNNALTRLSPRSFDEPSRNYLKLIKKDLGMFPRIVPIEDYSNIVAQAPATQISRLYVSSRPHARHSQHHGESAYASQVLRQMLKQEE